MTEQEEYEQYLVETGQKKPVATATAKPAYAREDGSLDPAAVMKATFGSETPDYGAAMNNALSVGGGTLAKAVPKLGGVLGGALEGGAMGAAQTPGSVEDKLKGFLTGGALQGGIGAVGKALGKVGDVAMQTAVNRKKYTPGVGTGLAEEGLWGTEGMLKGQVKRGLERRGAEMRDIAKSVEGTPIRARDIGTQVGEDLAGPIVGRGTEIRPSQADLPDLQSIGNFAEDIMSRGDESVSQALERRAAAGHRAWRGKENPANSLVGKLSKSEQQGYSKAIKEVGGPRMAEADKAYSNLARARTGLEQEAGLPKSIMGLASMGANKIPGGSLVASTVGQAGAKGGKLAEFLAPLARQAAVGGVRDPGPSADELAEYEQYLRETDQK